MGRSDYAQLRTREIDDQRIAEFGVSADNKPGWFPVSGAGASQSVPLGVDAVPDLPPWKLRRPEDVKGDPSSLDALRCSCEQCLDCLNLWPPLLRNETQVCWWRLGNWQCRE